MGGWDEWILGRLAGGCRVDSVGLG
jgi:hypothetical protein